ncbi:MAG: oligosaccharide flippase family protein [Thermodesulfobacteriota bacterium]|nr:oligosaccharide flippase family protein [Thermodesulfobacteriota bacterium]
MLFEKLAHHRRRIIAVVCGQVLSALGTLVGVRLLTEFVSPAVFGQYKLLLAAISLATGILIRPVIQFVMREYHDAVRDDLRDQFCVIARKFFHLYMVGVSMMIALLLYGVYFHSFRSTFLVVIIAVALLLLQASVEYERALFTTRNKQTGAAAVNVAAKWGVPLAIVGAIFMFHESVHIMLLATMGVLLCIRGALIFTETISRDTVAVRKTHNTIDRGKLVREAFRYSRPLMVVGIFSWIVNEGDRYFLNYYQTQDAVGIYSAAYGLVSAPFTLVVGTLAQFLYPIVFQACSSEDPARHRRVIAEMLKVTITVCVLGLVAVALFGDTIARIGLGEEYRAEAAGIMVWVAAGYGFLAVAMTFDMAAYGHKRTSVMVYAYGTAAIFNIIFDLLLIPELSILGAAIATTIAFAVYLFVMASFYYLSCKKEIL